MQIVYFDLYMVLMNYCKLKNTKRKTPAASVARRCIAAFKEECLFEFKTKYQRALNSIRA